MKEVILTQGKVAIVDDVDFVQLSKYKWCATYNPVRGIHTAIRNGKGGSVYMHRQIMDAPKGTDVDHINRNPLDNRRCNLRFATRSENLQNAPKRVNNTSGFKGVIWCKSVNKWRAAIGFRGAKLILGYFDHKTEAAEAYDRKATELFGEFAFLNTARELIK
jgi:hypothetical protein